MESKASANIATILQEFIDDVGISATLVCDFASEQTDKHTEVMRIIRQSNIKLRITEKGRGVTQNDRDENSRDQNEMEDTNARESSTSTTMGLQIGIYLGDPIHFGPGCRQAPWTGKADRRNNRYIGVAGLRLL